MVTITLPRAIGKEGPQGPVGPVGPQGSVGPRGIQGEQGIAGPQGETGAVGPKGDAGPAGADAAITGITVATGAPGSAAQVSMGGTPQARTFALTVPRGDVGATPSFSVGTVTTGAPGSQAAAALSGTPEAPVLNMTIPRGATGATITKAVATKADLASIPSPVVGDSVRVMSDPLGDVPNGNGVWSWTGSAWSWVGPWVDPAVQAKLDSADAARRKYSYWPDPWFRLTGGDDTARKNGQPLYLGLNFGNRTWDAAYRHAFGIGGWKYDPSSPYLMGFLVWWDDEISPGDTVSIGVLVKAASGEVSLSARHFDSVTGGGNPIWNGGQINGSYKVPMDGTEKVLKVEGLVVPPGAKGIVPYLSNGAASDFRVIALWAVKGASAGDSPPARDSEWESQQKAQRGVEAKYGETLGGAAWAVRPAAVWSSLTTVVAPASVSVGTVNPLICGWGDILVPSGVAFNGIRIPQVQLTTPGGSRWDTINVVVRKGAAGTAHQAGATVVAVGSVRINPDDDQLTNVTIPLRHPATGVFITLADGDLAAEYGVLFYARDAAGNLVAVNQPLGPLPNRTTPARSYYIVANTSPTTGAWANISANTPVALSHVMLTGLKEGFAPTPALASALAGGGGGGGGAAAIELIVPPILYGVQGREMNCYFDNRTFAPASRYYWDVTQITVGKQQNERWTYIPDATAQNASIGFEIYNQETGLRLASASATLRTAQAKATAFSRRILFLGDSTTASGSVTSELLNLTTANPNVNIELIGTKGTAPNRHEGNSGWTVARWHQPTAGDIALNPFSNAGAVFDFGYGMANGLSAYAAPDWVVIHLGINDVFNAASDAAVELVISAAFPKLEAMIASIRAFNPAIKIAVCVAIPPAAHQDAFGNNYGANQTRWRYKRNWLLWCKAMIAQFKGRQAGGIYLVPYQVSVDSENNFPRDAAAPVNSRSSRTAERMNNGVHPDNPAGGYRQMADAVWAFLHVEG